MHSLLIVAGLILVFMIVIHLIFRMIKFTFAVFFFGVTLIAVIYVFRQYLCIDLIDDIARLISDFHSLHSHTHSYLGGA